MDRGLRPGQTRGAWSGVPCHEATPDGGRNRSAPGRRRSLSMTDRHRFGRRSRSAVTGLSPAQSLAAVYELLLHRAPDATGTATYLPGLEAGTMSPAQLA